MSDLFLEEAGLNITKKCKYTLRQSRHGCETQQGGEYEIEPLREQKLIILPYPLLNVIYCQNLKQVKTQL